MKHQAFKTIGVRMPSDLREAIERDASACESTPGGLVRAIVAEYYELRRLAPKEYERAVRTVAEAKR